jgi:hypothetical protein
VAGAVVGLALFGPADLGKSIKPGADKWQLEIQEVVLDGKKLPPEAQIRTRKK